MRQSKTVETLINEIILNSESSEDVERVREFGKTLHEVLSKLTVAPNSEVHVREVILKIARSDIPKHDYDNMFMELVKLS